MGLINYLEPKKAICVALMSVAMTIAFQGCSSDNDSSPLATDTTANTAPIANAGVGSKVMVGTEVVLDGSGSFDDDGDELVYTWSISQKPIDSLAALDEPAAVKPTFTADKEGVYTIDLTVNDGIDDSEPDSVTITTGVDWEAENHSGEDLSYLDLSLGIFTTANLSGTDITGTNFYQSHLQGADLSYAYFYPGYTINESAACLDPPQHMFTGADLTNADFTGFDSGNPGAGPSGYILCEGNTQWMSYSFQGAILAGAVFNDAQLDSVDFRGADLTGVEMNPVYLQRTNFTDANLSGATIVRSYGGGYPPGSFTGATMIGASITGDFWASSFDGADLTDGSVQMTYLSWDVSFIGSTLVRTNITISSGGDEIDFTDADLTDATVTITGPTIIWSNTTCPNGTNSDNNGGTCVGHL